MAVALQSAHRRKKSDSYRDCCCTQELQLLVGNRSTDAEHGALFRQVCGTALLERCTRRLSVFQPWQTERSCLCQKHRTWQGIVCELLRSMPLQQTARAHQRSDSQRMLWQRLSEMLEQLLAVDPDRGFQVS